MSIGEPKLFLEIINDYVLPPMREIIRMELEKMDKRILEIEKFQSILTQALYPGEKHEL